MIHVRLVAFTESLRRGAELLHVLRCDLVSSTCLVVLNSVDDSFFGANVHAFSFTRRLQTVLNTSTVAEIKRAGDKYKIDFIGAFSMFAIQLPYSH